MNKKIKKFLLYKFDFTDCLWIGIPGVSALKIHTLEPWENHDIKDISGYWKRVDIEDYRKYPPTKKNIEYKIYE